MTVVSGIIKSKEVPQVERGDDGWLFILVEEKYATGITGKKRINLARSNADGSLSIRIRQLNRLVTIPRELIG